MIRLTLVLACWCLIALPSRAADWRLAPRAPDKPAAAVTPPPPDPDVLRQGGDTIADAVPLPLPAIDVTGTTIGYTNDYYEGCPYGFSLSPDVVYSITPATDMILTVDLCGSSYDTHVWVYTEALALHACNDDFYGGPPCGAYVSKIEYMPVTGGELYYVVINGYGGQAGPYLLNITEFDPCEVTCPPGAAPEGEPPLADGYVDLWNGGCNTDMDAGPFQTIDSPIFCGVAGWFTVGYDPRRDTDWFLIEMPADGVLEIAGDAEFATYLIEVGPQDCAEAAVVQSVVVGPCGEASLTITGEPGSTVWLFVAPTTFESPYWLPQTTEYAYVLHLALDPVATETVTFSAVKGLFD